MLRIGRAGPLAAACLAWGILASAGAAAAPENIARDARYTLSPRPDYVHCTDPGDALQLTDGETTSAYFWTQKGTVGWSGVQYATVTLDLGKLQPISGVSLTTAAGVAGVTWPASVRILVSDDGTTYRDAGDLVSLDRRAHGGWPEGYAIRRLATSELETRGRYVRLVLIPPGGGPYIFTDEVEVFRGPDALLEREPAGATVESLDDLFRVYRSSASIRHRYAADLEALRARIAEASIEEATRGRLLGLAEEARGVLDPDSVAVDASFRATIPFDAAHARLFELHAALWRAEGAGALSAVPANPWDPLELFAPAPAGTSSGEASTDETSPEGASAREAAGAEPAVEVHALLGEHRAAAVNVASAGEVPRELRLRFEGLPGSPSPPCVTVAEVPWTDTGRGVPVAAALPEAERAPGGWRVRVLPGLVRQVWLSFRATDLEPGTHSGAVVLEGRDGEVARVPVRLRIYPVRFPERTRLLVGGWSYTNGGGRYGMTASNREAFGKHLRDRFVNAPWASSSVLMSFRFSEEAPGGIDLDTRELDEWISQWPDASAYLVFLAVAHHSGAIKTALGDAEVGSADFDRRVATWISAWVAHLRTRGIAPGRLGLLIHDEPHEGSDVGPLLSWARAIRAAEPEVLIWEDPTYRDPAKAPPELFEACDVLCPNRPMWLSSGATFEEFYLAERRRGKVLHLYSCSGPARLLDPYSYYRLQAWQCARDGATGSFFWAFGDNGGASSWNEYLAKAGPFTPLFLDGESVTAGKQMEAIRESVEDYETLLMLRDSVEAARAAGRTDDAFRRAESLLEAAAREVLDADGARGIYWHEERDRSVADRVRVRALEAIVSLR